MADKKYIISLDSGTQSVRAVLFDDCGNEIAIFQHKHEPYFSEHPGWCEAHTSDYWSKLCLCTRELMASVEGRIDKAAIIGVGITSQRTTVFPVDKDGAPLRPAVIWLDQRENENPPPLSRKARALFKAGGLAETMRMARKRSLYIWIKQNEPEIFERTHKFMQVSGWFGFKLTGEFKDSTSMMVGYWPIDFKRQDWHSLDVAYEGLGISREQCVDLVEPNEVIGRIHAAAASETGLPEGLPVVIAGGDKQCEVLGAGAIDPHIGVISFGTAAAMEIMTPKYVADRKMRFYTWPASVPKTWDIEMFIYRGFWMVTWFKQEFAHREALEAERRGVVPEVVLDETIRDIPPGCLGLMLQPYWSPLQEDKFAKGSIIGFGDVHTRAHMYRAIIEGLGFEFRRMYDIVRRKTGYDIKEIRVGGGGSKSDVAVQMAADMFNVPVSRMATSEIAGLGAAIDVAVGVGRYASFEEACQRMVRKGQTFNPNREAHKVYDRLYREVYLKTFKALKPLNKRIARIIGYPADS